jgi:two-component system sensor histidine kinase/response regulator
VTQPKETQVTGRKHSAPSGLIHDLRAPLNQIIGYSELLTEQAEELGQSALVPDLQKVRAAGRQLLDLIEDSFQPIDGKATVDIPLQRISHVSERSVNGDVSVNSVSGSEKRKMLVVDDIEANRDLLSRRLERLGFSAESAENGRQAIEMLRDRPFDLVLLDIMMPEMDGYEVLLMMKSDEQLKHIPVIMISALTDIDSVVRCIQMGAEDYLHKPFNPTLLKARIGACLGKKLAHDREIHLFEQLSQNFRRLQELERQRDDLTNMIVHDLRTPLSSVILGMQTLDLVGDLNDDQRQMMIISIAGGETLLGMINDLLDVEKMESGSMPLEYSEVSIPTLVSAAIAQVASLAQEKRLVFVQLVAENLPSLWGDEVKLRRTLVNLIGNAIKFSPTGGLLTVSADSCDWGSGVRFAVIDVGEGIPEEAFGRIFEKFGQVESRKGGRNMSTGLGLTFCKLAVEAHGGLIGVDSTLGTGSTFWLTIPLATS